MAKEERGSWQERGSKGRRGSSPPAAPPGPPQALKTDHAGEVSRVLVTEGRDRVGGNITSVANEAEGYLWEEVGAAMLRCAMLCCPARAPCTLSHSIP